MSNIVLGLDPGKDKTGFAFVSHEGDLLISGIFPSSEREKFFADFTTYVIERRIESCAEEIMSRIELIVIGDGTTSKDFVQFVRGISGCEVLEVDERNTTIEARSLYWRIHEPGFFTRLLPEGMRVPERVLDDLAAWAVALRGLKKYRDIRRNKL